MPEPENGEWNWNGMLYSRDCMHVYWIRMCCQYGSTTDRMYWLCMRWKLHNTTETPQKRIYLPNGKHIFFFKKEENRRKQTEEWMRNTERQSEMESANNMHLTKWKEKTHWEWNPRKKDYLAKRSVQRVGKELKWREEEKKSTEMTIGSKRAAMRVNGIEHIYSFFFFSSSSSTLILCVHAARSYTNPTIAAITHRFGKLDWKSMNFGFSPPIATYLCPKKIYIYFNETNAYQSGNNALPQKDKKGDMRMCMHAYVYMVYYGVCIDFQFHRSVILPYVSMRGEQRFNVLGS